MGEATGSPRGRPPGSISKIAAESRAAAQATGKLPHEILLEMARGTIEHLVAAKDANGNPIKDAEGEQLYVLRGVVLDLEQRRDAAKAAAPYYAPKISTVEVIAGVSDDDLDRIIASAAAEAGVGLGVVGEGEADEGEDGEGSGDTGAPPATAGRERRRAVRGD